MNVEITRDTVRLDLTVAEGKCYAVYINGNLCAEGIGGTFDGTPKLQQRLHEARASVTAIKVLRSFINTKWREHKDHVNKDSKRLQAAAEGFIDGLNDVTQRFECYAPSVPSVDGRAGHKGGPSYVAGYDLGKWLRRCLEVVDKAQEEMRK